MLKLISVSLMTLTLTACQTTRSPDAIPESVLQDYTCWLLKEVYVDFTKEELSHLSKVTKDKAKKNPAAQKRYKCAEG